MQYGMGKGVGVLVRMLFSAVIWITEGERNNEGGFFSDWHCV